MSVSRHQGSGMVFIQLRSHNAYLFHRCKQKVSDAGSKKQDFIIHDTNLVSAQCCGHSPGPARPSARRLLLCYQESSIPAEGHQSWKWSISRTSLPICSLSAVITSSLKGEYPQEGDQIKSSQSLHDCQILQEDSWMLAIHNKLLQPNTLLSNLISEMLRGK